MVNPIVSGEFMGRLVVSYKDGETIYAYDEITHGLYEFSFCDKKVSMVLSPKSIFPNLFDAIMGISKSNNEMILIPSFLNSQWIFYDVEGKKVRYSNPIKKRIRISGTITIGMKLFLIPFDIYNPIMIVSLDDMKTIKIYEKWYNPGKENKGTYIWGASSYGNFIVFPIIHSNCIGCMNRENLTLIKPNIPDFIQAVSICKDRIWILPEGGEFIYASNLEGEIVERVSLSQTKSGTVTNKFIRIAATEESVFLLPLYGEDIYTYLCKKRQIVQIGVKDSSFLQGRLYERELMPYWDFIIENKTLHLLPRDCRYKEIDVISLENKEYTLCYGENIDWDKYWKMLIYNQKDCMYEKRGSELKELIQSILCFCEAHSVNADEKVGRQIWENVIKRSLN